MARKVRKRAYDSSSRRSAAEATRRSILDAARRMFLENGYVAATMPAIAEAAGIAMDTVYATVGEKPALFRLLIEMAISGEDGPVPAEERDYVRAIKGRAGCRPEATDICCGDSEHTGRLAPLFRVLQGAAALTV